MFKVENVDTGTVRTVLAVKQDMGITYFLSYTNKAGWIWFAADQWKLVEV